jgi:hypothetical protein
MNLNRRRAWASHAAEKLDFRGLCIRARLSAAADADNVNRMNRALAPAGRLSGHFAEEFFPVPQAVQPVVNAIQEKRATAPKGAFWEARQVFHRISAGRKPLETHG